MKTLVQVCCVLFLSDFRYIHFITKVLKMKMKFTISLMKAKEKLHHTEFWRKTKEDVNKLTG
jgi:hypothetical protein